MNNGPKVSDSSFYRDSFELHPDALVISVQGFVSAVNAQAESLFGYSREELVGRQTSVLFSDAAESGVCRRKDGSVFLAEIATRQLANSGLLTVVRADPTFGEAAKALADANRLNDAFFNSSQTGLVVLNRDLRYLAWNHKMEEISGFRAHEVLGKHPYELFPFLKQTGAEQLWRRALDGETLTSPDFQFDVPEHGRKGWSSQTVGPVRDSHGDIVGVIVSISDVTERKSAEDALRESEKALRENERRLEEAQKMAHLGSYSSNVITGEMEWSDELYRIYEVDPARSRPSRQLVLSRAHPDDRALIEKTNTELMRTPGTFDFEHRLLMPDGRIKHVLVQGIVSTDADSEPRTRGTVQDITERKRAEEEREKLQAQLAQAQKMESIGRLAGGVAHDFNNMLTVILGYATLCHKALAGDPKLASHMGEIVKAATRSKEIAEKLLGFSRQQIIAPVPSNLNEIIAELKEPLSRLIGEDVELIFNRRAGLWKVVVDAAQINQILLNLVVNARDAMPHGGKLRIETANVDLSEEYRRRHPETRRGRYVLLTVRDTGVGMDHDTMAHIFEPFYTTKDNGKGTGLGLATVYGIVQQNGGFITVESELQIGTVFRIYFPKMTGEELPVDANATTPATHIGHGTILLVEDDESVREITKVTLEAMGYSVLVVDSARHAIERCAGDRGKNIRMILTDVVMPDMNGMELRDRILEINPAIRVLLMSGYTPNLIVNHGVLQKGVHFIQKPFTMEDLGRRLEEVLGV